MFELGWTLTKFVTLPIVVLTVLIWYVGRRQK
jgi:hypothetical protein